MDAKKSYYHETFVKYKNNMKKTWKTINETLGKRKKVTKIPTTISYNNNLITTPSAIANAFNTYFATVGTNLASNINVEHDNTTYKTYLQTPLRLTCTLTQINENDVLAIINKMDNKSSSGHDAISNKILKSIKVQICKALCLIINQSLETGIFPDVLKIS